MKRVIEKGNLAFNHMQNICDLCKRCKGFKVNDDDVYDCKYNTDGKGLKSGIVRNHMQNYKCKYFKRHQKYTTCQLQSKSYTTTKNHVSHKVVIKKGKMTISKI